MKNSRFNEAYFEGDRYRPRKKRERVLQKIVAFPHPIRRISIDGIGFCNWLMASKFLNASLRTGVDRGLNLVSNGRKQEMISDRYSGSGVNMNYIERITICDCCVHVDDLTVMLKFMTGLCNFPYYVAAKLISL